MLILNVAARDNVTLRSEVIPADTLNAMADVVNDELERRVAEIAQAMSDLAIFGTCFLPCQP